ncbi:uncharacterized protein F4807DRAFT_422264 [Annulohypoxylon truncatum]|uniref:uncharacterized protein n=1 Tax=Annulohypoxylon truncatum TaxID=327061 RepID=UPI002008E128|nr:uncharacterized protein F4807DRAFT_422264 [Annulohypoxylon truncatum]KAI1210681.1 hypothetical protein F4807DRAFT_422264 [Annulohypoxylon truncatum]
MTSSMTKRLARLNMVLANTTATDSAGDQVPFAESRMQFPEFQGNMEHHKLLRKCEGCKNTFPAFEIPVISVGDISLPHYICHSCSLLTPAQRTHEKAPYWSAILKYWRPEVDPRAPAFAVLEQNSISLLCCLHELAKYYTWNDVTIMVNSVVMERLRHGPKKFRRYAVESDFFDVYAACKNMQFYNTIPEELQASELKRTKLILCPFGLVIPEPGTEDDEGASSACAQGWMCPNILPPRDRIIFTYAYRNRHGCEIRTAKVDGLNKI